MKSIVTGAAGFIGSHLTDQLLSLGHTVYGIDNISNGTIANLDLAFKNPKFHFIQEDITARNKDLTDIFNSSIDYIFHLAALADIVPSINNPTLYYHNNVTGTLNLLDIIRTQCPNLKKLCYAASSSCYGITDQIPTPETALVNNCYPYALTKNLAETTLLHWNKVYKIPSLSLRLFNVYGPRSQNGNSYGAVLGTFLSQLHANKPLTIVGDGNQKRDFIYVTDVVDAFVKASLSKYSNEIFNIGSGNPQSVNKLASLIGGEKIFIPKRPGEPDSTYADITKAKSLLKWQPTTSLEAGVKLVMNQNIDWLDQKAWSATEIKAETADWFKFLK